MNDGHPTERQLIAYAAGHASEGVTLALAAHLTYCPACRDRVSALETLAGSLLEEAPGEMPNMDAILDRLDESDFRVEPAKPVSQGPLPRVVASAIGVDFEAIPWQFRLPGVHEYAFAGENGEEISLLKVRPGAAIPQHTHEAHEITVVFDGELIDGEATFRKGDLAVADPSVDHHPRAGGDRVCICLAVLDGGLKFTGPFGRALNLFT